MRMNLRSPLTALCILAALLGSARASSAADDDDAAPPARLLVSGDFNHDGILDLAEAILPPASGPSRQPLLSVALGQPDGSLRYLPSRPIPGAAPHNLALGDFNRDGIPDLIVGSEDGTLSLYLGDGSGALIPAGPVAHLASVVSMVVGDFNHDGIPDLAVSDWRSSSVTILLGTGNASFRPGWSFPLRLAGTTPRLTVADFNADGIPDLAVVYADDDGFTFDVMVGTGSGTFTPAPNLSFVRDRNSHCAP